MRFMTMWIFENSMISEDIHLSHRNTVQFMIHPTCTDSSQFSSSLFGDMTWIVATIILQKSAWNCEF